MKHQKVITITAPDILHITLEVTIKGSTQNRSRSNAGEHVSESQQ